MTKAKGYILPFFIPHSGCPRQCVFCNQNAISGKQSLPSAEEILNAMKESGERKCQLAFYGGSFTAMDKETQLYYLETAKIGLQNGWISGIRISTRPDYINEHIMKYLSDYGVDTVELGVQSLNNETLQITKRGHTAEDSVKAVKMLLAAGFKVGVQLMPGLPGDDKASVIKGAKRILSLKPHLLRIYPTVVVEKTELADMYKNNCYKPLDINEAVEISAAVTLIADYYNVNVIRTGLNTDESLEREIIAGPYHSAFGNLVKGFIWCELVVEAIEKFKSINNLYFNDNKPKVSVFAAKNRLPLIFGQNSCNKSRYEEISANMNLKIKSYNEIVFADFDTVTVCGENLKTVRYSRGDYLTDFMKKLNI